MDAHTEQLDEMPQVALYLLQKRFSKSIFVSPIRSSVPTRSQSYTDTVSMDSMGNVASMSNDLSTDEQGINRKSRERELRQKKRTNSIFFDDCWVDQCFVHTIPYITKNLEIKVSFFLSTYLPNTGLSCLEMQFSLSLTSDFPSFMTTYGSAFPLMSAG